MQCFRPVELRPVSLFGQALVKQTAERPSIDGLDTQALDERMRKRFNQLCFDGAPLPVQEAKQDI